MYFISISVKPYSLQKNASKGTIFLSLPIGPQDAFPGTRKKIYFSALYRIPEKSDIMKKPVIRDAAKENDPEKDIQETKSSLRWIILIPFIIVLGVLAAISRQGESTSPKANIETAKPGKQPAVTGNSNSESSVKKMVRNNIRLYVKAESNDYDTRNLGGISNLEITVNNPTDYTLDKVRVKIMYIKANGNVYETKYEDYFFIRPNSQSTHKIDDTKRGTSVKYEIATIKSKALGL